MRNEKQIPKWLLPVIVTAIVLNILIQLGNYYNKKQLQEQEEFYQLADKWNEELNLDMDIPHPKKDAHNKF